MFHFFKPLAFARGSIFPLLSKPPFFSIHRNCYYWGRKKKIEAISFFPVIILDLSTHRNSMAISDGNFKSPLVRSRSIFARNWPKFEITNF